MPSVIGATSFERDEPRGEESWVPSGAVTPAWRPPANRVSGQPPPAARRRWIIAGSKEMARSGAAKTDVTIALAMPDENERLTDGVSSKILDPRPPCKQQAVDII